MFEDIYIEHKEMIVQGNILRRKNNRFVTSSRWSGDTESIKRKYTVKSVCTNMVLCVCVGLFAYRCISVNGTYYDDVAVPGCAPRVIGPSVPAARCPCPPYANRLHAEKMQRLFA